MRADASLTAARLLAGQLWPGNLSSDADVIASTWAMVDRAACPPGVLDLDRRDPRYTPRLEGAVARAWRDAVLAGREPVASIRNDRKLASACIPLRGRRIRFCALRLSLLLALAPADEFALAAVAHPDPAPPNYALLGLRCGRAVWFLASADTDCAAWARD